MHYLIYILEHTLKKIIIILFYLTQDFIGYSLVILDISQLYKLVILFQFLSVSCLFLAKLQFIYLEDLLIWFNFRHSQLFVSGTTFIFIRILLNFLNNGAIRLNFHISILIGLFSIGWSGHLIHVAIPEFRGSSYMDFSFTSLYSGNWIIYSFRNDNSDTHIFGFTFGSGISILTFIFTYASFGVGATFLGLCSCSILRSEVIIGLVFFILVVMVFLDLQQEDGMLLYIWSLAFYSSLDIYGIELDLYFLIGWMIVCLGFKGLVLIK